MAEGFPEGFLWGASTSAFQIEGAAREDGRGPSIWDNFSREPGRIADGQTADMACDHYHRWPEDVALLRELGIGAYRFSISWPRILPEGRGAANAKGLEFYDRLADAILETGIEPWLCLYHWDLPQALEDRGGWRNRDTAMWFADYAHLAVRRLGDRVRHWITFNEPAIACIRGYGEGAHAPGERGRASVLAAIHAMNLAHGHGIEAMRGERADLLIGAIHNFQPCEPADDRDEDEIAALALDALWNRSVPDPQFLGRYPDPIAAEFEPFVQPGDMDAVRQKLDFFALTHYRRARARRDPDRLFEAAALPPSPGAATTGSGWEIAPDAFRQVLVEEAARYAGDLPVYVLGNGAAFPDRIEAEERIRDQERIRYLRQYLGAALDAIAAGVKLRGYFVRSLLDGFEWAEGYGQRFGLVHVDFDTQTRRPKDSFDFYAALADGGGLDRE